MKRSPIVRKTELKAKTELKTKKPLQAKTPLKSKTKLTSKTKLKPRSKKMEEIYVERRILVIRILSERPVCEIRWDHNCNKESVDVHERLPRSVGGKIVGGSDSDYVATCRYCHTTVTDNPAEAHRRGWIIKSWEK